MRWTSASWHSVNASNFTITGSGSFAPSHKASHGVLRACAGLEAVCGLPIQQRRLDRLPRLPSEAEPADGCTRRTLKGEPIRLVRSLGHEPR